jgi:glycogen debranching enzyme
MKHGDKENGGRLAVEAQLLKERFNRDFWIPESHYYAQALDGSKRQVPAISSNAGHTLFCGIADSDKAAHVVKRLMSTDVACGWGLRTLSSDEPHFNPMSYHNGSVWPHDNGIIAAGMRRYGFDQEAIDVIEQVVQAGIRMKLFRMPELYCGFARDLRYYSVPAEYPVSCSPQAWAAGAILHFCQVMLGAEPDVYSNILAVKPYLLASIAEIRVAALKLGANSVDLDVERQLLTDKYSLTLRSNPGNIEIVTE